MAKLKVMLHPKVDAKGVKQFRLALRVTHDGKRSYSYLGYNIDPSDWDSAADKVKRSNPKHAQLNRLIRKKYDELDDVIYELKSNKNKLTPRQIIDSIKESKNKKSFFDFAHEHIADLKKIGKHNRAISENSMINRIREFVGSEDLFFEDITEGMLKRLKIHLKTNREISERSVMNIYVFIRLIFNNALKEEAVDAKSYPFGPGKLKIKYPDSKKIGLNKSEILAIEELELEKGSPIWDSQNIFLFSFYLAGIRISDALKMKWTNVVDDRLYYKMGKNDKGDSLKLPEKAIKIINYYKKSKNKNNGLLFPFLKDVDQKNSKLMYSRVKTTTKRINRYLEQIAVKAGVDKKVTTHIARHSFGNIAGSDIPVQMLQKLYRHSDLSTTIGYQSNFDHTKTDEALNDVLNF